MKVVSGNPDPNHVSGTEVGWKARSEAHQRTDLQSCSGARAKRRADPSVQMGEQDCQDKQHQNPLNLSSYNPNLWNIFARGELLMAACASSFTVAVLANDEMAGGGQL